MLGVGIAVVGFCDNALTVRAFAARHGQQVVVNTELAALGPTNLASGLLQGFPVSCSGSRTSIADAMDPTLPTAVAAFQQDQQPGPLGPPGR